jgi:predicted dehydrogenase
MLNDFPAKAELKAVCDLNEKVLDWYKNVPTVDQLTTDYKELLANPAVDVVYVAVPHNLHLEMYLEVLARR